MQRKKINWTEFRTKASKILGISWKVALIVIGLFCSICIYALIQEQLENHYSRRAHYDDCKLSERIGVHCFKRDVVRIYDNEAGKFISPELKWVSVTPKRDSVAVFCDKDDKRGFVNANTGEIVIEGMYKHAWVFSEGLAAVVEDGKRMGFIDHNGNYVIAPELPYSPSHDYLFKHGVCCIENLDEKFGLLDKEGKWVVSQEYDNIEYVANTDAFILTQNERKGLVRNGDFTWIYPLEYNDISWEETHEGNGYLLYKDFRQKLVSAEGHIIKDFVIDETSELEYVTGKNAEDEKLHEVSNEVVKFRVQYLWGLMDKHTGRVILPAKFGSIHMVSDKLIECHITNWLESDAVLYDLKGIEIIQK